MATSKSPKPNAKIAVTLTYEQWVSLLRGLNRLERIKPEADENRACYAAEVSEIKHSREVLINAVAAKIAAGKR